MEESQIDGYTNSYPFVSSFVIHPNGGGRVCTRSKVDLDTFVGPRVTILRSIVTRGSHLNGHFIIQDSRLFKVETTDSNLDSIVPSEIRDSHILNSNFNGNLNIHTGFIVKVEIDAVAAPVNIKFFHVGHSYLKGKINLEGLPREFSKTPERGCPELLSCHIEGEVNFVLPHGTIIHSTIIKPKDSPLKAQPNRNVLTELLESIPVEDTTIKEVVWAYEQDGILAEKILE